MSDVNPILSVVGNVVMSKDAELSGVLVGLKQDEFWDVLRFDGTQVRLAWAQDIYNVSEEACEILMCNPTLAGWIAEGRRRASAFVKQHVVLN